MNDNTAAALGAIIGVVDMIMSVSIQLQKMGAVMQKAQDEKRDLSEDELAEITANKAAAFAKLRASLAD